MKKTVISIAVASLVGFSTVGHAGSLSDIFTALVGKSGDAIQADVINKACVYTATLKTAIQDMVNSNTANDAVTTQYGFSKAVAAKFKYGGAGADATMLTQFINAGPSGSLTAVCPFPLQGYTETGQEMTFCTNNPAAPAMAYLNGEQLDGTAFDKKVDNIQTKNNNAASTIELMTANGDDSLMFSGIRFFGADDSNETVSYVPIAVVATGTANSVSIPNTTDEDPKVADFTSANASQICPSGTNDGTNPVTGCKPAASGEGMNLNVAEYEIYQIGETSGTATTINSTLWSISWEFMNEHADPDTGKTIKFVNGTLDVFPIDGDASKEFDQKILDAAKDCGEAGFVK